MTIEIMGTVYPARYTVHAENLIAQKIGGIENLEAAMEKDGSAGAIDIFAFMVAALIEGGVQHGKVESQLMGKDYLGPEPISYDTITQLLQPGEIIDLKDTIMEAIREGNKTNIELKKTAKKKSAP